MKNQQSFIFLLFWIFFQASVSAYHESNVLDLPFPAGAVEDDMITLNHVQKILNSELATELGIYRLDYNESKELWKGTLEYEWALAKEREIASNANFGRRNIRSNRRLDVDSPFVVCDMNYGKSGEDRRATVESIFGVVSVPLYNKIDMTCFIVKSPASLASNLPTALYAVPLTVEMKMAANLAETIANSSPLVSRIEVMISPEGSSEDLQSSTRNIFEKVSHPSEEGGRRLRAQAFLESRYTRDTMRAEHWKRHLVSVDDEVCQSLTESMTMESSQNILTFHVGPENFEDTSYRECFQAIVVDLAMQPDTYFVGAYRGMQVFNELASGIIQSGKSDSKPFHDIGLDGKGQIIALSDTGLDTDNCYLWDALQETPKVKGDYFNPGIRKVIQYVAYADSSDKLDGHGTHVAGSMVGRRATDGISESDGSADGIAKAAKVAFFDVGLSNGRLSTPLPSTLFPPGYKAGARIHSISWGTPLQNYYSAYDQAIDAYMYDNPDFLVVIAGGNDGRGNLLNSVGTPGICKNGIAVGASQNASPHVQSNMKGPDYLADFSSRGPTSDGRRKPDVVAPGQFIWSLRAVPDVQGECDTTREVGTTFKAGTSMAAPIVAGAAALVRQYFEEGWHITGSANLTVGFSPRSSLIKAVLLNGGQALLGIQNDRTGTISLSSAYDQSQGFGRVDLISSLPVNGKNNLSAQFTNGKTIKNDETDSYTVIVEDTGTCIAPLSATLVWTDPAGAPNCKDGCVLNDLDLYIVKDGENVRYFPNGLSQADTMNNAERVKIDSPEAGSTYKIYVEASQLLQDQEYSLVITGCFTEKADESKPEGSDGDNGTGNPENKEQCVDKDGTFPLNDIQSATCFWLGQNFDEYSYLCRFLDVAQYCPSTCSFCLVLGYDDEAALEGTKKEVSTPIDGKNRWYGYMFDMTSKKRLAVTSFDIHINYEGFYQVQVHSHQGSRGTENNWEKLCDTTVQSEGYGVLIQIPEDDCSPIEMPTNTVRTFYVTLVDRPDLVVSPGRSDQALVDNEDLRMDPGVAVTYFNGATYQGFSFNGGIHYTVLPEKDETVPKRCVDEIETVFMDQSVGQRSCSWLRINMDRFGYVCDFGIPALHCPVTCGICGEV